MKKSMQLDENEKKDMRSAISGYCERLLDQERRALDEEAKKACQIKYNRLSDLFDYFCDDFEITITKKGDW